MGVLLLAATPVGGDPGSWAQWGLAGAVVGATIIHSHMREKRMSKEIASNHRWVRNTLLGALGENTSALNAVMALFEEEGEEE